MIRSREELSTWPLPRERNPFKFELGADVSEKAKRSVRSACDPIGADVQRCLASLLLDKDIRGAPKHVMRIRPQLLTRTLRGYETLASIGRVVTSALMLVLSLGLVRLTLAYYQFSKKAEQVEREAGRQLKTGSEELEAVKAWHDYQVSRAGAPLIPSSLWRWMNKDLNEAWLEYRGKSGGKSI